MPEGHVSHRNAGLWRLHLVGHRLDEAWACAPQAQAQGIPARLRGEIVSAAEARGKHHLLRFESGRVLHSHLRMVGVWRLLDRRPRDVPQLTLCLRVGGRYATLYRCQEIRLLEPGAPLPLGVRTLGPDLLDPDCDGGAALVQGARRVEPSRQVGEVVMDQRVVSGIGNVFKSEALFLAGVNPWGAVGAVPDDALHDVGRIARELLTAGVASPGRITTYRRTGPPPRGRGQTTWVYGRSGRPCRVCGTPVRSRGQGDDNRTTFWCPTCQPLPERAG